MPQNLATLVDTVMTDTNACAPAVTLYRTLSFNQFMTVCDIPEHLVWLLSAWLEKENRSLSVIGTFFTKYMLDNGIDANNLPNSLPNSYTKTQFIASHLHILAQTLDSIPTGFHKQAAYIATYMFNIFKLFNESQVNVSDLFITELKSFIRTVVV